MSDASRAKQLMADISAERSNGQRLRRMMGGVTLAMFVLAIGNGYYRVKTFDTEAFVAEVEIQASSRVWPMISRELDAIAADATPALSAAFVAEAEALMPKIEAQLAAESVLLQDHAHARMKDSLDKSISIAAGKNKDALKERFPQFSQNEDAYNMLMTRLQARASEWAQVQLDTTFSQHIVVLQSINETVEALRVQADPKKTGEKSMEDVLMLFLEIMNSRLEAKG